MSDARRQTGRGGAPRGTVVVWSQVFVPDAASVGQHVADVVAQLAQRGQRVLVLTSDRGYDDARVRYPRRGQVGGAEVLRLPFCSFGKKSFGLRGLGALSFMVQCLALTLLLPRVRGIFFSTSPPLVGVAATLAARLRRIPAMYWAMDINPDQLVALGHTPASARVVRWLEAAHRFVLRRAALVVTLDRFMAARLASKVARRLPLLVLPPWPHEDQLEPVPHEANPFRARHGLQDKVVVMYSGNHSASNPLDTLLEAAVHFREHPRLRFLFVGAGNGKAAVEACVREHGLNNVVSLPYQPLSELRYSLSAADVHVVSLGDPMVGIIHPCKIYGAMAVGRPILYVGPEPSHVSELLAAQGVGWRIGHGDVAGATRVVQEILDTSPDALRAMGVRAQQAVAATFSQQALCRELCDRIEAVVGRAAVRDERRMAALPALARDAEPDAAR